MRPRPLPVHQDLARELRRPLDQLPEHLPVYPLEVVLCDHCREGAVAFEKGLVELLRVVGPAERQRHPVPLLPRGEGGHERVGDDLGRVLVAPLALGRAQFHEQDGPSQRRGAVVGRLDGCRVAIKPRPPLVERDEVVLLQVGVDSPHLPRPGSQHLLVGEVARGVDGERRDAGLCPVRREEDVGLRPEICV